MILLRNFEIRRCSENKQMVMEHLDTGKPFVELSNKNLELRIRYEELLRGRVFKNSHGEEVVLAMPEVDQQLIGLPFELFDKQKAEIESLQNQINYEHRVAQSTKERLTAAQSIEIKMAKTIKDTKREVSALKRKIRQLEKVIIHLTIEK